jgi:hypothetical protein
MTDSDVTLDRLEDQIGWYDNKSMHCQRMFKWLKGVEIGAAAFIPLAAGAGLSVLLTGLLGVLVVVLEGLQHLNQYQQNWISYRSTCEALKHEKFLHLAHAGPYADAKDAHAFLAERIESLVSQEHAKWVSTQEQLAKAKEK